MVLGPLPYDRPEALTLIWSNFQKMGAPRAPARGPELVEVRAKNRAFQDVAGIWVGNGTLVGEPEPEQIKVASVTANFLEVLGARPALGRSFLPGEQGPGARRAIVISDGLWRRRYGADAGVIGRTIRLDAGAATVVGVMPRGFEVYFPPDSNVPREIQAFVPFPQDLARMPRSLYYIRFLGRLKPGVSLEQGQQDLDLVAKGLRDQYVEYNAENLKLEATPLARDSTREVRPALVALMIGAAFVLLISCVNVANLLLARAVQRRKEIAVRASIGASRGRIVRQLLAESLTVAAIAGVAGVGIGWAALRVLLKFRPDSLARVDNAGLNLTVLAFIAGISLVSAILFGLLPAIHSTKLDLVNALRDSGHSTNSAGRRPMRAGLIIAEITLGFVLLTGAGLMILTFLNIQRSHPGFDSRQALTFEIELPGSRYRNNAQRSAFVEQWEAKLAALPGVHSVGAVSQLFRSTIIRTGTARTPPKAPRNRAAPCSPITARLRPGISPRSARASSAAGRSIPSTRPPDARS